MNIITKTALSNFRLNKSRNILIGTAIILTTLLLTIVPSVGFGMIDCQFKAVNEIYPNHHGMYRNVSADAAKKMQKDSRLSQAGLRQDPGQMIGTDPEYRLPMIYTDETTRKLNRVELESGRFPKKADEIVASKGLLEAMGLTGDIGDTVKVSYQPTEEEGLGLAKERDFTIVGMTQNSEEEAENKIYSSYVSLDFVREAVPAEEQKYRVYFRVGGDKDMTTDEIEARINEIAEDYGIKEDNIVVNSHYLIANYVDPSIQTGIVIIMAVIVLAGILTIYSIYYVSMIHKVQEYGKLKAVGATKRQIRQLVFREGFAVAAVAIPIGLIIGGVASLLILRAMIGSGIAVDNIMVNTMLSLLNEGKISVIRPFILATAAVVALITVYFSLLRPMGIAARISPIEAIRYAGTGKKNRKKTRKGYAYMDIRKLTASNLGRNRRRTVITIVTLSMTGILFMVCATVISCINPSVMTEEVIRKDVAVSIEYSSGDRMHPENELNQIQKDNPLDDELEHKIRDIDGVKDIEKRLYAKAGLEEAQEENGDVLDTGIGGLDEECMEELKRYVTAGSLEDSKLYDGTGIILSGSFIPHYVDGGVKVGDTLHLAIRDGDEVVKRKFRIVAAVDAPGSLTDNGFTLPDTVLQGMCGTSLMYGYNISIDKDKVDKAAQEIKNIAEASQNLQVSTWKEVYDSSKWSVLITANCVYGMMGVLGLIGILNLINTMINSVYVRRRELGILQAIGLSGKQTVNMLQMEGMFYTAGTLIISLGLGSIIGYRGFLWAKENYIMSIRTYHYPLVPALILIVTMLAVQVVITCLVNNNFKKQSLIDRIRFAE